MKHTQTATVREMRTLANTCKTQAADAAEHLKVCQRLSEVTCDNAMRADQAADRADQAADRADQAAGRTFHAEKSAEDAAWRANRRVHEAQAAANIAADAARDARKASRATIITLLATAAVNIGIATAIFCLL